MRSYDRPVWSQEDEWQALRTTARCEKAILPIGSLPVFPRGTGRESTESDEGSDQSRQASIASHGDESNHEELPTSHMRPVDELGFAVAFRGDFPWNRKHQDGAGIQYLDRPGTLGAGRSFAACLETKAQKIKRITSSWQECLRCHSLLRKPLRKHRLRATMRAMAFSRTVSAGQLTLARISTLSPSVEGLGMNRRPERRRRMMPERNLRRHKHHLPISAPRP